MKILIVGGGGREHALAWKVAQSPLVGEVLVAPGNAGTAGEDRVRNVPIGAGDIDALVELAGSERIDLTIVGPEQPLVAGIVDRFAQADLACFGPTRSAARLEGSKAFTKDFLARHGIPTAAYRTFTAAEAALDYLQSQSVPVVIKADGLAAGKGVVVAETLTQAQTAVKEMLEGNAFGSAGKQIVVEEYLTGEEASFIAIIDGEDIVPLASSQDHKTRDDGDRGPNTGGMGAYSPAPIVSEAMHDSIMEQVMRPTVAGLRSQGIHYRGFLYAGLMITQGQPKVLEFNCRFGDPETQPVLFRLRSDLVELCLKAMAGKLGNAQAEWDPRPALGVVLAADGYPGHYEKGHPIHGLTATVGADAKVFHAGTRIEHDTIVTNGGRVLCAVALGDTVTAAQQRAYAVAASIHFDGVFYRRDIGYRAIARELAHR